MLDLARELAAGHPTRRSCCWRASHADLLRQAPAGRRARRAPAAAGRRRVSEPRRGRGGAGRAPSAPHGRRRHGAAGRARRRPDHHGRRRQGRRRRHHRRRSPRAGRRAGDAERTASAWSSSTCRPATCALLNLTTTAASPTWSRSPTSSPRARSTRPSTCTPPACACCSPPSEGEDGEDITGRRGRARSSAG